MAWRFTSFRGRIFSLVLGILVVTQVAGFFIVNYVNTQNASQQIEQALVDTAATFRRLLEERTQGLMISARLLSADFAFKRAYATHEAGTILSALGNHRRRINADFMMLTSMDVEVIADTLHPRRRGAAGELAALIAQAEASEYGETSMIVTFDGQPYQAVVVPLLIPEPDAWIVVGFKIDDQQAEGLRRLSSTHVSFLQVRDRQWQMVASTLAVAMREELSNQVNAQAWSYDNSAVLTLQGDAYVSLPVSLVGAGGGMVVVLQRSLGAALEPTRRLGLVLAGLFTAALVLSLFYTAWLARSVTRPVLALTAGARRVSAGDYATDIAVTQQDEIGELADSFNGMMRGLAERDRVRDLLGKVVSPAIAEELLSHQIELGGEERVVTVLFSDVRNFTALCEGRSPQEILGLLNRYLTRVSAVIDGQNGVVDKYIGDAVMALFGAPVQRPDDAECAIRAAFGMCEIITAMNQELSAAGMPRIAIGVGINTGEVVAGNMGSETRMNYTVIGDNVNLASRLEGLSKVYGVSLVVSAATRKAAPGFVYRQLDRVRVKGKQEAVEIFEPLAPAGGLSTVAALELEVYETAQALYRQGRWGEALTAFDRLHTVQPDCRLYALYAERCEAYQSVPPSADADGGYTHTLDAK